MCIGRGRDKLRWRKLPQPLWQEQTKAHFRLLEFNAGQDRVHEYKGPKNFVQVLL
jgi:hypothetical protein